MKAKIWILSVGMLWLGTWLAEARFVKPTFSPVDRLITNTEAYLEEHPSSDEAHFALARIHYLAFFNKSALVPTSNVKPFPKPLPHWRAIDFASYARRQQASHVVLQAFGQAYPSEIPTEERPAFWQRVREQEKLLDEQDWKPEQPDQQALLIHATAALKHFQRAIELNSDNALYHLGLASFYEQTVEFANRTDRLELPAALARITLEEDVCAAYYKAYELSITKDIEQPRKPPGGLRQFVGYEAGQSYVRLMEPSLSEEGQGTVAELKERLEKLEGLPRGPITPIIFSLNNHQSLEDLLAPDSSVAFDLNGDGVTESWSWVQPDTAILVWDPERRGHITSGRQLFGSVTWWVFFPSGYHALGILDDDRDGLLNGPELEGLSVWHDRNSDGLSGPGEVVPVQAIGVQALKTTASGTDQDAPMNRHGLVLEDGTVLPTYDWISLPRP